MEGSAMSTLLTSLGEVFTWIFTTGIPEVATTIVETPLLLFTTGILLTGGVIGIFGSLLSKN